MTLALVGRVRLPEHAAGEFDHGDVHMPTGRVFVAHTANGTVEIIDGERLAFERTLHGCPEGSGVLCTGAETSLVFAAALGAGTVLVEPVEDESVGILDHVCRMNGEGEAALYIPAGGSVEPASVDSVAKRRHFVVQDGPAVFKAAVTGMAEVTEEVLKRNDVTVADLTWLVPHQANRRIIEAVAKRLGLGLDRVILNLDRYGNTVGATIPIALSEWNEQGRLAPGDRLVLSAFGAGFTAGSVYLRWAIA